MAALELISKCVNKDRKSWDVFVRRYEGLVLKSVRYKLNKLGFQISGDEIRDIVQEVFLLIWEKDKLSSLKDASCLKGWLAIIALNVTQNYCRKNFFKGALNTVSLEKDISNGKKALKLKDTLPSPAPNALKKAVFGELRFAVDEELSKLETRQQLALRLSLYESKNQRDIAKIMGIPIGTAATLIKRGKTRIKSTLRKKYPFKDFF